MDSPSVTLEYFAKSQIPPLWEVFEVLYNPNHPMFSALMADFDKIDIDDLELFLMNKKISHLVNKSVDPDISKKAYFMIDKLTLEIYQSRIEKLIEDTPKRCPYNSHNLQDLDINQDFLVNMRLLSANPLRLQWKDFVYMLCPTTQQDNSSYWLAQTLRKYASTQKINFLIRLDPWMEIPLEDYSPIEYRMIIYGRRLNWERLKSLRAVESGRLLDENDYTFMGITDYAWSPMDTEVHFTCEELPKRTSLSLASSRYFHAIFNKTTGKIKHCDGAVRIYSRDELSMRLNDHVKNPGARKVGKRVKIFQFDSVHNNGRELEQQAFVDLAVSFYVWNDDILAYFNVIADQ